MYYSVCSFLITTYIPNVFFTSVEPAPKDLEKYIRDLEKLSQKFKDLAKDISEIVRGDKEGGIYNSP